jgi:murein DD-endopeptidase MepM/ murein hydrolase activator NlpD
MITRRPKRPVAPRFPISQRWGVEHPRYALGYHTGTDFAAPMGTRVRAPRAGIVIASGWDNSYGNYVHVRAGKQSFLVAHLSKRSVRKWQPVFRGQTLGKSGNSGMSTAPHVHAEQRRPPFGFRDNVKPGWE